MCVCVCVCVCVCGDREIEGSELHDWKSVAWSGGALQVLFACFCCVYSGRAHTHMHASTHTRVHTHTHRRLSFITKDPKSAWVSNLIH